MSSAMQEATTATTADRPILPRTGLTYGHSLSSDRSEDRERTAGARSGLVAGITSKP
jgi:hypothetical protein